MTVGPLSSDEAALTGFTHKAVITHDDLTDTDTAQTLELFNVRDGSVVYEIAWKLITAFDASGDAAINSLTFEMGDSDPDRLVDGADAAPELAVDGTEVFYGSAQAQKSTAVIPYKYAAADTVDITFTVAGGASPTLAELDSGEVEIYARIVHLDQLAQG